MNSLPQNFLVVNHEGVHRCSISIEQVTDFDQLIARFAKSKMLVAKNLASHPNGRIHLAMSSRDALPMIILEATKGTIGLQTQYQLVKTERGEWISPRFFRENDASSFELRCEFDFEVWASAGFKMFFALDAADRAALAWSAVNRQNYRVPFGNVFDTGVICTGNHIEEFFNITPFAAIDKLLLHLGASVWNADAFDHKWIEPVSRLVRFDSESLKMMIPLQADNLIKLGVMANPMIAEITKQIYG